MDVKLEDELRQRIRRAGEGGETPREVIADMLKRGVIQNEKQAHRTLEKWIDRGEYDYGVSLDLGWIYDKV